MFRQGDIVIYLDAQKRPAGYVRLLELSGPSSWKVMAEAPIYNFTAKATAVQQRRFTLHTFGAVFSVKHTEILSVRDPLHFHHSPYDVHAQTVTDEEHHFLGTVYESPESGKWSAYTRNSGIVCAGESTRESAAAVLQRWLEDNAAS